MKPPYISRWDLWRSLLTTPHLYHAHERYISFHVFVISRFLTAQVPYVDVCDDAGLATVAKGLNERAQEAGVAATISAGIWPGVDQLMAVEVCTYL